MSRRPAPRSAGFTLLEMMVSTMLLAAALALAFATLRAASSAATRGEELSRRNQRMRAVEGFMRRRIASALPLSFDMDEAKGAPLRFVGSGTRMRFVADLPPYLGRGGPYLHEFSVVDDPRGGLRLQADFKLVMLNEIRDERQPRPPELLAGGLRAVRFQYRAIDAQNRLGEWRDTWEQGDHMPLQVRIDIVDGRGERWPSMVVSLPQAASYSFQQSPI